MVVEDGAVELDTSICGWITVETTAAVAVEAGAEIDLFALHAALTAEAPAEAEFGVRVEDRVLWEVHRPIPSTDAYFAETFPSPVAIAEGDRLLLHVHNHGANTYRLGHLRAWTTP